MKLHKINNGCEIIMKKNYLYLVGVIGVFFIIWLCLIIMSNENRVKASSDKVVFAKIKNHYFKKVITNTKAPIYAIINGEFIEKGQVNKGVALLLDDQDIFIDTKYFKIRDSDYYIEYQDVSNIKDNIDNSTRYQYYIPFNENIITKENFTIYKDDKAMFTFNDSMEFPIIIKDYENQYYIEYQKKLLSIKKEDIKEIVQAMNTNKTNQKYITTLAYHRVYGVNDKCNDPYICMKKDHFDKQMKYLKDNKYLTITMKEMYLYLQGKIQVEKAVCITMDDGYLFTLADEILGKYGLNGTLFVITSDFKDYTKFMNLKNFEIQSHTHNMHRNYMCPKNSSSSQGGALLCASEQEIQDDFQKSLELLGVEPWGLAYPFYDYNEKAVKALAKSGLKMGFVGRAGQLGKSYPNKTDLLKIPRMTVWEDNLMSFNTWKSYL